MNAKQIAKEMLQLKNDDKALILSRYFKEKNHFIGITVPVTRKLAQKYASDLPLSEINILLESKWHEIKLFALHCLVINYETDGDELWVRFYLDHLRLINNWDFVDSSAYKMLGHYTFVHQKQSILKKLIQSSHHWSRRVAIISTYYFIKQNELQLTFELVSELLKNEEPEDLMHKAAGWMLREAGKKNQKLLIAFLKMWADKMPRTMLRYSIEKFSESERKKWLAIKFIGKTKSTA